MTFQELVERFLKITEPPVKKWPKKRKYVAIRRPNFYKIEKN